MKTFIKKVLFFLALLMVILVLKKSLTPYYIGNRAFGAKLEYFNEVKQQMKFNTVFFGSSRIYRHVNPLLFDSALNRNNVKSFNFATPGTFNPESLFLYEEFIDNLDDKEIKYAFLELQPLSVIANANVETTKASYWNNLKYLSFACGFILHSDYKDRRKYKIALNYFKSFFFGYVDFDIVANAFKTYEAEREELTLNGFYPLDNEITEGEGDGAALRQARLMADTTVLGRHITAATYNNGFDSKKSVNRYYLRYLKELIKKSKQKGVKLIFVVPPRLSKKTYDGLISITNRLPEENVIKLINPKKYKELYMAKYSFDRGHLNLMGANVFTKYLAKEFKKNI